MSKVSKIDQIHVRAVMLCIRRRNIKGVLRYINTRDQSNVRGVLRYINTRDQSNVKGVEVINSKRAKMSLKGC